MKRIFVFLCIMTLLFSIISGCGNPASDMSGDASDFEAGNTPDSEVESTPHIDTGRSQDEYTQDLEWVIELPDLLLNNFEPDPAQTGELNIFLMNDPYQMMLTPVIDLYRKIYPNVELKIEHAGGDNTAYNTRLSTELMAGKGPDLFFPGNLYETTDIMKLAETGIFADLNEFIESDDSFDIDAYIKPVMDGGILNGKRYLIPITYMINNLLIFSKPALPSKLDEIGFDKTKMNDPTSFVSEIVRTLPKAQETAGFKFMYNTNLLFSVLKTSGIKLFDTETKEILPEEEHFERLIKAYKPYYQYDSAWIGEEAERNTDYLAVSLDMSGGKVMFTNAQFTPVFIWKASSLKRLGGYELHAMPNIHGNNPVRSAQLVAVGGNSPNKQNAWNFIKLMLSPENQSRDFSIGPVHRDSVVYSFKSWYEGPGQDNDSAKLSNDEVNAYISMYTNVDTVSYFETPFHWNFIFNHLEAYFKDEIGYEEAVARIKSDLRFYLSE